MKTTILYLTFILMLALAQTLEAQKLMPGKNAVTFKSEGLTLKGNLYLPPTYKKGDKLPAIVVGGSWTTVKEQMAGLYADKLSKEGYVTLAFDHRYYGESEGEPRFYEDPEAKTVDFIHAAEYLKSLPMVDKERIGGMGVCASGGYMGEAVARSPLYKSYAMVVPWFNTDEVVNAFYGGKDGISERIIKSRAAEKQYKETGVMAYIPAISDSDKSAAMYGPFTYYLDEKLGKVPNWSHDKFALTSWEPWLTYRPVPIASRISTPTLIITSKEAATPAADEQFYNLLKGKKELIWMEGGQLDFYYQPKQVNMALDKVASHFSRSLQ
jgi:fermentation-respiration switch protein FrsA (DUF1100 family)